MMNEENAENKVDVADVSVDKLESSLDMKSENDVESSNISSPMVSKRNSILKPKNNDDITMLPNEVSGELTDRKSDLLEKLEFSAKKVKQNSYQVSLKTENRTDLFKTFNEATGVLERLKTAFHAHKTKTFFRPDVSFNKGMSAALNQVESGLNKMGQLFSTSSDGAEKSCSTNGLGVSDALTPPVSEAGTDIDHNDSTSDTSGLVCGPPLSVLHPSRTRHISDINADAGLAATKERANTSAAARKGAAKQSSDADTKVAGAVRRGRGYKRKRNSIATDDVVETVVQHKKPKRSLMSDFLQKEDKEESEEEDEADTSTKDPQKKDEFEVDKIISYDRIKGKCMYQVRWRGYGPNDDTWEPLDNLTGCEEILLSFIRTRLVERSKVSSSEELKSLLLPTEDTVKPLLRAAFFAQLTAPPQQEVESMLPLLSSGKVKVKEMHEIEEDVDKLVAIKDCLSERYNKMVSELKQQLALRECKQQRERQKAELRRWEREMSRICSAPAPLSVINDVDLSLPPKDFVYINDYVAGPGITIPQDPMVGCECTDCANSQNSCCAKQMGSYFAYSKHGRLKVSLGTAIYECNKACACAKAGTCLNRVVQKGRTVQLTIFRTSNNRGWGVKAGETIRAGSFVTEYVGEVISSEEAERRGEIYDARGCTYLFDLDYNKGDLNPYTVDAAKYGNVSHFINHSCDPNLVVFNVWVNNLDPDMPKLALFATREIKKGEEMTFDYNSPSARPQNAPTVSQNGDESSKLSDQDSPARLAPTDNGSLELSVRKTPKRGNANGKTVCRCGAANCRQFFF